MAQSKAYKNTGEDEGLAKKTKQAKDDKQRAKLKVKGQELSLSVWNSELSYS